MDGGNAKGLSGTILAMQAKLPLPAHAPYLHPCRQSFRSLLTLLTYIPVGIKKASASAGFFCPVSVLDCVQSVKHFSGRHQRI